MIVALHYLFCQYTLAYVEKYPLRKCFAFQEQQEDELIKERRKQAREVCVCACMHVCVCVCVCVCVLGKWHLCNLNVDKFCCVIIGSSVQ